MDQAESEISREAWYALAASCMPSFTPVRQHQLLACTETFERLFTGESVQFNDVVNSEIQRVRRALQNDHLRRDIDSKMTVCAHVKAQLIAVTEPEYPVQLKALAMAPPLLFVLGDPVVLHLPQLAVVGSRRMTPVGASNARNWSRYLAESGFTLTSGLALGIDAIAHKAALDVPGARTVAVMATGIDIIYPRRHSELAQRIEALGSCLVTEFLPGQQALPRHFPQRNRLISGLSLGVLVVEAAMKSGSLITARLGMEQNKEVFAIPGSVHNPLARGCHYLIKQGAHLVDTASDITDQLQSALQGLRPSKSEDPASVILAPTLAESQLLAVIGYEPIDIDHLTVLSGCEVAALSALLIGLELRGLVAQKEGLYHRLC